MTDQITVAALLPNLIHRDAYLDTIAMGAVDLRDAAARREFAAILRKGDAIRIAPRIYGWRDPIGTLMMAQYGGADAPEPPAPHLVAAAMARQYGWRLAMPVVMACSILGLAERPLELPEIPYDQPTIRHYDKANLTLIPAPADLFDLSPAGQCLRQALPRDASGPGLVEIGEQAGGAIIATAIFLDGLRADLAAGRLTEREILVANAIVENVGSVGRRAPKEFVPPPEDEVVATVDQWREFERDGTVFLTAQRVTGHPHLSGDRLSRTSPVIWIDEQLGYARTRSRLYRLGKKEGA
jgi:hypothetical protein